MHHSPPQILNSYKERGQVCHCIFFVNLDHSTYQIKVGLQKGTVSLKNGENTEMSISFICMGAQDRTLIDINHHYQIMMNQHEN